MVNPLRLKVVIGNGFSTYTMLTIHSSPLQGFTDFRFRNAFQQYFGGIDQYIAPYIRVYGKLEIKTGNERDKLPANNRSLDHHQVLAKVPYQFEQLFGVL